MGPNTAFCFVVFGLLFVYCEFIWPGKVWPSVLGLAAFVSGAYYLWRFAPTALGLELLGAAALLFLLDAFVNTRWLAGTAATIALSVGFVRLIIGERAILPVLCIPWCLLFGLITMALNWAGRRARSNKRVT